MRHEFAGNSALGTSISIPQPIQMANSSLSHSLYTWACALRPCATRIAHVNFHAHAHPCIMARHRLSPSVAMHLTTIARVCRVLLKIPDSRNTHMPNLSAHCKADRLGDVVRLRLSYLIIIPNGDPQVAQLKCVPISRGLEVSRRGASYQCRDVLIARHLYSNLR